MSYTRMAHAKGASQYTIDLHGYSKADAKALIKADFERAKEKGGFSRFLIITGRGNHVNSDGTRGVLLQYVPEMLKTDPFFSSCLDRITLDASGGSYQVKFNFTKAKKASIAQSAKPQLSTSLIMSNFPKLPAIIPLASTPVVVQENAATPVKAPTQWGAPSLTKKTGGAASQLFGSGVATPTLKI